MIFLVIIFTLIIIQSIILILFFEVNVPSEPGPTGPTGPMGLSVGVKGATGETGPIGFPGKPGENTNPNQNVVYLTPNSQFSNLLTNIANSYFVAIQPSSTTIGFGKFLVQYDPNFKVGQSFKIYVKSPYATAQYGLYISSVDQCYTDYNTGNCLNYLIQNNGTYMFTLISTNMLFVYDTT